MAQSLDDIFWNVSSNESWQSSFQQSKPQSNNIFDMMKNVWTNLWNWAVNAWQWIAQGSWIQSNQSIPEIAWRWLMEVWKIWLWAVESVPWMAGNLAGSVWKLAWAWISALWWNSLWWAITDASNWLEQAWQWATNYLQDKTWLNEWEKTASNFAWNVAATVLTPELKVGSLFEWLAANSPRIAKALASLTEWWIQWAQMWALATWEVRPEDIALWAITKWLIDTKSIFTAKTADELAKNVDNIWSWIQWVNKDALSAWQLNDFNNWAEAFKKIAINSDWKMSLQDVLKQNESNWTKAVNNIKSDLNDPSLSQWAVTDPVFKDSLNTMKAQLDKMSNTTWLSSSNKALLNKVDWYLQKADKWTLSLQDANDVKILHTQNNSLFNDNGIPKEWISTENLQGQRTDMKNALEKQYLANWWHTVIDPKTWLPTSKLALDNRDYGEYAALKNSKLWEVQWAINETKWAKMVWTNATEQAVKWATETALTIKQPAYWLLKMFGKGSTTAENISANMPKIIKQMKEAWIASDKILSAKNEMMNAIKTGSDNVDVKSILTMKPTKTSTPRVNPIWMTLAEWNVTPPTLINNWWKFKLWKVPTLKQ